MVRTKTKQTTSYMQGRTYKVRGPWHLPIFK